MDSRTGPFGGMDPSQLWGQWYETGTKMWNDLFQGRQEAMLDPYGLYRQWFEGLESARNTAMDAFGGSGGASNPLMGLLNNPWFGVMSNQGFGNAMFNPLAAMTGAPTKTVKNGTGQVDSAPVPTAEAGDVWRKWFEATAESWQKSADLGQEMIDMTPRWLEMIAQSRDNMMAARSFPKDPLEFAVQWYNATSGPLSEFVQDVIEREEFLAQSSRYMRNYASLYKIFSRNSEQYLKFFQLPVRSDITRLATLVIGVEEKVDRIEEAFEDFEYGYAQPATAESVDAIDRRINTIQRKLNDNAKAVEEAVSALDNRLTSVQRRLTENANNAAESAAGVATAESVSGLASRVDRVEGKIDRVERKLDQLLSALENAPRNGGAAEVVEAPAAVEADGGSNGGAVAQEEIKATDAARRKAEELGVDLATVQGTGSDGQITVGDVRQKGENR